MGYYATWDATITVPFEKEEQCLRAINDLHTPEKLSDGARGWGGGRPCYSWVNNPSEGGFKTLEEAIRAWSLFNAIDDVIRDHRSTSFIGSHDSKIGQEVTLLKAIAPFIDDTEIACQGGDGEMWLWRVRDGVFSEHAGRVVYDD